jgi:chaperone required for assembly of F1-ATPase
VENGVVKEGDILNQGSAVIKERVVSYLDSNDLCYYCQFEKHIRAP